MRDDRRRAVRVPTPPNALAAARMPGPRGGAATLPQAALARLQVGRVVTFQEEIAALRARIRKAESERDVWRASGRQEKYLEAYLMVDALELQLERLRKSRGAI